MCWVTWFKKNENGVGWHIIIEKGLSIIPSKSKKGRIGIVDGDHKTSQH